MSIQQAEAVDPPRFPLPRRCPVGPPAHYAEVRAHGPLSRVVMANGQQAWLVVSHELARRLLADERLSSLRTHPGYPEIVAGLNSQDSTGLMSWMDGDEHAWHRGLMTSEFTLHRMRELRPRIQEFADAAVDALLRDGPPADLVSRVSLAVPAQVICEVLGVSYEDRDYFYERIRTNVDRACTAEQRTRALGELRRFLDALVTRKETDPGDDLTSRMIAKYRAEGRYDHAYMSGAATLLLVGGFDSSANMISLGIGTLLEHPDQLSRLREDPALTRKAVDELLRYHSISDVGTSRVALEDIEVEGVVVRAGEGLVFPLAAANWDPAAFAAPERFDIERDARRQLAFGYGAHQCLGQNLVHTELDVVLRTLIERVPTLRLAIPFGKLPFKYDALIFGIHEVPVTW